MAISTKMTRKQFAAEIVKHLHKHDISCVLVGGSCVSIYTDEKYKSRDLDFISPDSHQRIADALEEIGFNREGKNFVHPKSKFYAEFPTGPLAIGSQIPVKAEGKIIVNKTTIKMLSPTQSVMDRLSAWFHWNDRRSLIHALEICKRHPVNLNKLKQWAKGEHEDEKYVQFLETLKNQKR
jgi:hypothetical protein